MGTRKALIGVLIAAVIIVATSSLLVASVAGVAAGVLLAVRNGDSYPRRPGPTP